MTETQASGSPNPQAYGFAYAYNLASEMLTQTYPSGRIVQTEYDTAGRVAGVKNQGGASYYAGAAASDATNRIQYASHGGVSAMKLGNGKWEHTTYDPKRLQPTLIGLGTSSADSSILRLGYEYTSTCQTANNGNVLKQTITAPKIGGGNLVLTQNYCYDSLNRLASANENSGSSWTQTYDYDRYGNRAVRAGSYMPSPRQTPTSTSSDVSGLFNQNNNRITATSEYGYDPAGSGNLVSMPNETQGADTMTYDAENRQKTYTPSQGGTTNYTYDGDGHRVKKVDPNSATTVFVYNVGGQLIAEYTSGSPSGGGTSYLTSDHLGSTRVVTSAADGSGNVIVKARYDYLPFGEEIGSDRGSRTLVNGYGAPEGTRQKFTQKERDNESGLDYFLARYYSSAQGRFTSADPGSVTPPDPQSWNRYPYVQNNPLKFLDPKGTDLFISGSQEDAEYLVRELSRLSGFKLLRDSDTGKVTIDTKSKRNKKGTSYELADLVGRIIGDHDVNVSAAAVTQQDSIIFDSFDKRAIDVGDVNAVATADRRLEGAVLGHALSEYYHAEKEAKADPMHPPELPLGFSRRLYNNGHEAALEFESRVMGDFTGYWQDTRKSRIDRLDATHSKMEIRYSTIVFDIILKSGGQVESVRVGRDDHPK